MCTSDSDVSQLFLGVRNVRSRTLLLCPLGCHCESILGGGEGVKLAGSPSSQILGLRNEGVITFPKLFAQAPQTSCPNGIWRWVAEPGVGGCVDPALLFPGSFRAFFHGGRWSAGS